MESNYCSKVISNFSSDSKKKSYGPISNDFHFSYVDIRSDVDIRKMKIVWNWNIIFFFGVGRKFWNHFWIVIRPHFIDCNHLKNHQSTPFCILSKWWQFWILSIGYTDSKILKIWVKKSSNGLKNKKKLVQIVIKTISDDKKHIWWHWSA